MFEPKDDAQKAKLRINVPDRLDRLERLVVADHDGRNTEADYAVEKIREEQEKKGWKYDPAHPLGPDTDEKKP